MRSKWFELKLKAVKFRKQGKSIRDIEKSLGIPRSTLSGWFRTVTLTPSQNRALKNKNRKSLIKARKKAVIWHNQQKSNRLRSAEDEAEKTLLKIENTAEIVELALALLYLGEGSKKSPTTCMGNSDPLILKFFLKVILTIYKIDIEKIRFDLHIRADQNGDSLKKYWAKELKAPLHRFMTVSIDKRTIGKLTYPDYKGVCVITCGNIAVQRKLVYIGRKFCDRISKNLGG
ncbi:MAG: helix-turn-helix domain-containing protein [bacterium]